jgi:hypothetical protein
MKELKSTVNNVIDLYNAYLTGGETGFFAFVKTENDFYTWLSDHWGLVTYTSSDDTLDIGQFFVTGTLDGLAGTFHLINYLDYLKREIRVLHHIETGLVYYRGDVLSLIWSQVSPQTFTPPAEEVPFIEIPLFLHQKDPVTVLTDMYTKYPLGGSLGDYAFVKTSNTFCYWNVDTSSWNLFPFDYTLTPELISAQLDQFTESTPTLEDEVILGGGKKATVEEVLALVSASNPEIYIGSTQPDNTFKLWIDTENNFIYALENNIWTVIGSSSKGISSISKTNTTGLIDTYTITYTDTTTSTFTVTNGAKGDTGSQGEKGDKGDTGSQGVKGDTGSQGVQGNKGDAGEQGIKGDKGDVGEQGTTGSNGSQGIQGVKGDTGLQGVKGDAGEQGAQGIQGIQGIKGDDGETGAKGDTGERGADGVTGANGTSVPVNVSFFKSGANGIIPMTSFSWISNLIVSQVILQDYATDISATINGVTYNKTTLIGIHLDLGVKMTNIDMTLITGQNTGSATIIF